MPNQVRIISQRNALQWDDIIKALMDQNIWRTEQTYGGITTEERADKVRRCLRTAGRHKGVGSKVYYKPCDAPGKCKFGADCSYHVQYAIFDLEEARQYKTQQSASQQKKR